MRLPSIFLIIAVLSCLLSSCSSKRVSVTNTEISLGTYVKIQIITQKKTITFAEEAMADAYKKIQVYESSFDYRSIDGALTRFNNSTSLTRNENDLLFALIAQSLKYAWFTDGYFDPTILPIIQLWRFDTNTPKLPPHSDISRTLELIGHGRVTITEQQIRKPLEVQFDLSGIAKGKIVDLIKEHLFERGFNDFLVDAGGDIYVGGRNLNGKKWRIAIQDPVHRQRYSGILEKSDIAIVTSGDYEKFFIHEGKRYHHLFNPYTGYPSSNCKGVTVVTEETAFGDAIATAVFVMGSRRGYEFLMENAVEGLIIYQAENDKIESLSTPHFWD